MTDYIEREALLAKFKRMGLGEHSLVERIFADGVYTVIAGMPAADVAPVVHGRWDENGNCTNCGKHAPYWAMASTYYTSHYCPNCGARMDGDEE